MDKDYNKMNEHYDKGRDLRMINQQDEQALQHVGQNLKMWTTIGWTMEQAPQQEDVYHSIWARTRTRVMLTMLRGEVQRIGAMCWPWKFASVEYISGHFYT